MREPGATGDAVAIVGMACTPFREHWDKGADDLLIEASQGAITSTGNIAFTLQLPRASAASRTRR